MKKEQMKARIHVKTTHYDLAELRAGARAARADDFSTWVRETLRKAARQALAKDRRAFREAQGVR